MKRLKEEIKQNRLLFFLVVLGIVVYIASKFFDVRTFISDWIYFATFLALLWYAEETKRIREIEQEPILMMYIRKCKKESEREYCIKTGIADLAEKFDKYSGVENLNSAKEFDKYLIRIRNAGKGPAFNLIIESNNFKVEKYQSRFFAPEPKGDEQSVKIVKKDGKEIKGDYSEFKNSIFKICCKNINGKEYRFKYKIVNLEKEEVEFIKMTPTERHQKNRADLIFSKEIKIVSK